MRKYCALFGLALLMTVFLSGSVNAAARVPGGLQTKINIAVDKGVEWLLKKQLEDGHWAHSEKNPTYSGGGTVDYNIYKFGITGLSILALLESDVPSSNKQILKGMQYLQGHKSDGKLSYSMAVFLMAAHSFYQHKFLESIKKFPPEKRAKKLKRPQYKIPKSMFKALKLNADQIGTLQLPDGGWRYIKGEKDSDASSTQFAILGLHAATKLGIPVKKNIFLKAAKYFIDQQEKDGPYVSRASVTNDQPKGDSYVPQKEYDRARGWPYIKDSVNADDGVITGGMTTVGICGLIVCKAHINKTGFFKKFGKAYNQSIFDGLAWLSNNWTVLKNPPNNRSYYYYLYGLERVGMLGGFEYFNGHNWYREGAEVLVDRQQKNGAWIAEKEIFPKDTIGTSFALLFLKRGTQSVPSGQPER